MASLDVGDASKDGSLAAAMRRDLDAYSSGLTRRSLGFQEPSEPPTCVVGQQYADYIHSVVCCHCSMRERGGLGVYVWLTQRGVVFGLGEWEKRLESCEHGCGDVGSSDFLMSEGSHRRGQDA